MSNTVAPAKTIGGFHFQQIDGDVTFQATGDIVAGDKKVFYNIIQIVKTTRNVAKTPYKFLAYYDIPDGDIFFGRDDEADDLAGRVKSHKVVVINGASGSGKSSLINAGLIPRLADAGFIYVRFRDYTNPVLQLQKYFARTEDFEINRAESLTLLDMFRAAKQGSGRIDERVAVILDQFERFFLPAVSAQARQEFFLQLKSCLDGNLTADQMNLVICIREDFFGQMLREIRPVMPTFLQEVYVHDLLPLQKDEAREAIIKPIIDVPEIGYSAGFVDAILIPHLVGASPGDQIEPAHLQIVCNQLFQQAHKRLENARKDGAKVDIDNDLYKTLGETKGILQSYLDDAVKQVAVGDPERIALVRSILKLMVYSTGTRRFISLAELERSLRDIPAQEIKDLIAQLQNARVIETRQRGDSATEYSVSHEVMVPKVLEWLDEREVRRKRAEETLVRGLEECRSSGTLLNETQVTNIRRWLVRDLTIEEKTLLTASEQHVKDRRQAEELARMQQVLAEKKTQVLRRWLLGVVLVCLIGVVFLLQSKRQERVVSARDLQERGIIALQANKNLEAQSLFAAAISNDDRPETRQLLIQALASGARSDLADRFDGDIVAIALGMPSLLEYSNSRGIEMVNFAQPQNAFSYSLAKHEGWTRRAAISKDSRWIAWETQTDPKRTPQKPVPSTLHLWDSLRHVDTEFDAGDRPVSAIAFSPDCRTLAFANERGTIWVVDLGTKEERRFPHCHTAPIWGLAINNNCDRLASCGTNVELKLWTLGYLSVGKPVNLEGHTDVVYSVAFSPDGRYLASGSDDSTVRLWDVAHPDATPRVLAGDFGQPNSLQFSSDGHILAAACEDRSVRVWDAYTATQLDDFDIIGGDVSCVEFTSNDTEVIAGGPDGWLRRWQIADPKVVQCIRTPSPVTASVFSSVGQSLFVAGQDGFVRRWSWPNINSIPTILNKASGRVLCLAVDPSSSIIAWASDDNLVHIFDNSVNREIQVIDCRHPDTGDPSFQQIWSVAFCDDGSKFAVANFDRTIKVFERAGSGNPPYVQSLPVLDQSRYGAVFGIAFAKDASVLASVGGDPIVRIWKVGSSDDPISLTGHTDELWGLAFSPDGTQLATGGTDRDIRIWDTTSHKLIGVLKGHRGLVNSLAFSPNGKWLASGSDDRTVRIWSLNSDSAIVLNSALGPIWWVSFSPDGKYLATAGLDGCVRVWDIDQVEAIFTEGASGITKDVHEQTGLWVDSAENIVGDAVPNVQK